MNVDVYLEELKEKLEFVLFDNDDSTTRWAFNSGARTMFNYACCELMKIKKEVNTHERLADSGDVGA